jgi:hypothetical protein
VLNVNTCDWHKVALFVLLILTEQFSASPSVVATRLVVRECRVLSFAETFSETGKHCEKLHDTVVA